MSKTTRARQGCQGCRLKHLKCDDGYPSCGRCMKIGVKCNRDLNIRFRHEGHTSALSLSSEPRIDFEFTKNQVWIKIPAGIDFIDETQDIVNGYGKLGELAVAGHNTIEAALSVRPDIFIDPVSKLSDEALERSAIQIEDNLSNITMLEQRGAIEAAMVSEELLKQRSSTLWDGQTPQEVWSSRAVFTDLDRTVVASNDTDAVVNSQANHEKLHSIYLTASAWPLQSNEEARLVRYFVEHIAESFDVMDKRRHFALVVPQRAALCPILLNAMYAASAKHLARLAGKRNLVSCGYSTYCLQQLIPLLGNSEAIMDENLLAATVILRFLESLEVPLSGNDSQNHLLGTQVFIRAQRHSTFAGTLREAAFWVGLRQDIYVAFVNQRPIARAFDDIIIDRSLEAADDFIWANRIVVHCADVLSFCFGDGASHNTARFNALVDYGQQWMLFKPTSFDPIFFQQTKGNEVFPQIWMLGQHTVVAMQHYHLSLILLSAHNPKAPRLGPSRQESLEKMDADIKISVKALCGIAVSNYRHLLSWVTACQGIAMCGERFTERHEQEALLNILSITEKTHGWPTGSVVMTLTQGWGWSPKSP